MKIVKHFMKYYLQKRFKGTKTQLIQDMDNNSGMILKKCCLYLVWKFERLVGRFVSSEF